MFELSVASKYLLPRRRQLSVSIISLISILVIALVVWLIVVFFSVTEGLKNSWINKLTALTAPVRITPTEAYYKSYYYQVDSISADSGYIHKSIGEKLVADAADPYNPSIDEEVPTSWPHPDVHNNGTPKDLVKLAFQCVDDIKGISGLCAHDYEMGTGNIRLRIVRDAPVATESFLTYPAYLGSFDPTNANLYQTLLPVGAEDLNNLLALAPLTGSNTREDNPSEDQYFTADVMKHRLHRFLTNTSISRLKTPENGWKLPVSLLPAKATWSVYAIVRHDHVTRVLIPIDANPKPATLQHWQGKGHQLVQGTLSIQDKQITLNLPDQPSQTITPHIPLILEGGVSFPATLVETSAEYAKSIKELKFHVRLDIQSVPVEGDVSYYPLKIDAASPITAFNNIPSSAPDWIYKVNNKFFLPHDPDIGDGVLVPKNFKDAGVLIGDRGYLSYETPTATAIQEQRLPVYVAGFYDPGIIPIGGKFILANHDITSQIRAANPHADSGLTNGINIRFNQLAQTDDVKTQLHKAFEESGIAPYWNIETYREYEFTKDLIQQLQSEKNLFTLLATVIIIVACSNIITMLIILVNDKKTEIGIMRSMGATSKSIAAIFGLCGCIMGLAGSIIGIGAAIVTLNNLQALIDFISRVQGYELFNRTLYGDMMPHEISVDTLIYVVIATALISLIAGVIPAVKASLLRPSTILRSE